MGEFIRQREDVLHEGAIKTPQIILQRLPFRVIIKQKRRDVMRKFLLAIFVLIALAVFVSCGRNQEQDIDFRAIRDVELGIDISLGMTLSDVEALLGQSQGGFVRTDEDGTATRMYSFDNGMLIGFAENMVTHIQASSPLDAERFEVLGHRIGDRRVPRDDDYRVTRSYNPDGSFTPYFVEDVYVLSLIRVFDGIYVYITISSWSWSRSIDER